MEKQAPGKLFAILVAVVIGNFSIVEAFPSGAGGCAGPDEEAVGGFHLDDSGDRPVATATLSDGAIEVSVGGIVLQPTAINELPIGEDLLIQVGTGDVRFRGVLARLQAPDEVNTVGALSPGTSTQIASVCEAPVVGITHMDNSEKYIVTGTMRFDEVFEGGFLSVTVVYLNSAEGSAYVFDSFPITMVGSPTSEPSLEPTSAPPLEPTSAPSLEPTQITHPIPWAFALQLAIILVIFSTAVYFVVL